MNIQVTTVMEIVAKCPRHLDQDVDTCLANWCLANWPTKDPFHFISQNCHPLTTNFSQNVTEPSKGISYPVCDLCRRFTKQTLPSAYTLNSKLIPQQMVQMAFCDLSHTFHK